VVGFTKAAALLMKVTGLRNDYEARNKNNNKDKNKTKPQLNEENMAGKYFGG
jgi:hypothetical protein